MLDEWFLNGLKCLFCLPNVYLSCSDTEPIRIPFISTTLVRFSSVFF